MYLCEDLSKFQSTIILIKGSISQSNFSLTLEVSSNLLQLHLHRQKNWNIFTIQVQLSAFTAVLTDVFMKQTYCVWKQPRQTFSSANNFIVLSQNKYLPV